MKVRKKKIFPLLMTFPLPVSLHILRHFQVLFGHLNLFGFLTFLTKWLSLCILQHLADFQHSEKKNKKITYFSRKYPVISSLNLGDSHFQNYTSAQIQLTKFLDTVNNSIFHY